VQIRLLQQVDRVDPGPPAQVHLHNGTLVQADLVIGADGLHSVARAELNGMSAPFFTGQVAWRAVVPNVANLGDEARVWMGPGRHLVAYPLRDGRSVNLVAVQERAAWTSEGWSQTDDPDNLRAAFSDFRGVPRALLDAVDRVGIWGLFRHPVAPRWHGGHLALAGDAAHPTLPFLAQGANMALEDIWALTQSLAQGADIPSALARYQAGRRGRAMRVISAANRNAWKYHLRGPVRGGAHLAMSAMGRLAPARLVSGFDWLYRYDVTAQDWGPEGQVSSSTQTGT
jgi:salicylate hydroxylase